MNEYAEKYDGHIFDICLEETHYNKLISKLFNILALGQVNEVGLLTVDGSPHCVQMHYSAKYLKRGLNVSVVFKHYVITKTGDVIEVDTDKVAQSKNLAQIK